MHKQLNHAILSLMLIFALMGQSFASLAVSCDMSNENTQTHSSDSHEMMDHSNMAHSENAEMATHDMSEHNCCDTLDCSCLQGTCSTLLLASMEQSLFTDESAQIKNFSVNSRLSNSKTKSLIRPPISA